MAHCTALRRRILKKQLKRADKSQAQFALIVGDAELAQQQVIVKALRGEGGQEVLDQATLVAYLSNKLNLNHDEEKVVELYSTEEQQEEALKKLWKEYGTTLITSLLLGFALYLGWTSYQEKQLEAREEASTRYMQALAKLDQPEDFILAVEAFDTDVDHAAYSGLLHLMVAKVHIEHKRYDEAQQMLQQLLGHDSPILAQTAQFRLARIQAELKEYTTALATLTAIDDPSFAAMVQELKGDIYLQQGQEELAQAAYQAAVDQAHAQTDATTPTDSLLQMKLDDLAHVQ